MDDTVTVASRAPMPVRIGMPVAAVAPPPEGMVPQPREDADVEHGTVVINGANHPSAVGGVAITRGVPAKLFNAWHEMQVKIGSAMHGLFEVVADDFEPKDETEYGFEPALARASESNKAAAEEGSTITHEGPVTSSEMDATSPIPEGMQNVPPDQIPTDVGHHEG